MSMKIFKLLSLTAIALTVIINTNAQDYEVRSFVFGHSLIVHESAITTSDETKVPHWVYMLAQEAGHTYACNGRYGFLPQHDDLPPFSQWGFDLVPSIWDSDLEPFDAANFNNILITAGNFIQYQPAHIPYDGLDGVTTPLSATTTIMDWVLTQEDSVSIYIYENWPDMAGFIANSFLPTADEFNSYNDYTTDDFHNWWIAYQDSLVERRHHIEVKMIPVGPIITDLLINTELGNIPVDELYEDDAPHGTPNIYFLAGLITYMSIYQEMAPTSYNPPVNLHEIIRRDYTTITQLIWNYLSNFNHLNGESRVFFEDPITNIEKNKSTQLSIYPSPCKAELTINALVDIDQIIWMNMDGSTEITIPVASNSKINTSAFKNGVYFLKIIAGDQAIYRKIMISD